MPPTNHIFIFVVNDKLITGKICIVCPFQNSISIVFVTCAVFEDKIICQHIIKASHISVINCVFPII